MLQDDRWQNGSGRGEMAEGWEPEAGWVGPGQRPGRVAEAGRDGSEPRQGTAPGVRKWSVPVREGDSL